MARSNTKLIPHRWDMHALQALTNRDPEELTRVFTELKEAAVNTQVKVFAFGAPMQFHSFGFFDKSSTASSATSAIQFDRVIDGDTMLLLTLRHYDPRCAIALIKQGASLHISNSSNEVPLQVIFDALAFLRLHPGDDTQERSVVHTNGDTRLQQRAEYETLFSILHDELTEFYDKQKTEVEKELRKLYKQFAPDRLAKIQTQLEAYVYREKLLLESAKKKYIL